MLLPIRRHYFSDKINREVKEIYWQALLANLAGSMTMLFEPIFLYTLHYSIQQILWFYMLVYLGYVILITPAAKLISIIGYKHAIFWSNIFYVAYWVLLYHIRSEPALFVIAPLFFALQKSFFWPPYHADIAINAKNRQRGREVGVLFALIQIADIGGPFLGGLVSAAFGFQMLFIAASILMLVSAYPLFRSAEIYNRHVFRFRNFWKILRQYPRNFFAYWGYAEDTMLMTLWPIYIFIVVPELLDVGFLVTIASFIAIVVMLYIGRMMDASRRRKVAGLLESSSVFYGITWIFRQAAQNFAGVFFFDALTRIGKAAVNVPLTEMTYKIASRSADYAIAYGVFYEFSLSIGKLLTLLGSMWIVSSTHNIYYAFIFAGALTMFYGFLSDKRQ